MGTVTAFVRRIATILAVLAISMISTGAISAAQDDRPDVPPQQPLPSLTIDTPDEANQGNDFQQDYASCREGEGSGLWKFLTEPGFGLLSPDTMQMTDNPARCALLAGAQNPADALATGIENTASAFWGDPVGDLAKAVMEGNVSAFATVMTFWMSVPIPALSGGQAIDGIRNITFEIQLVFLAFGIIFAGTKLAIARKQAVLEGAEETARMITRTVFAVTLLPLLVMILHAAGDAFSTWVITMSTDGDPNAAINGIAWIDEETGFGPVLSLLFAGISLLGSVVQLIALIVREGILTLAVALAPISAAISVTNSGRMSWNSIMTFTAGALLFKPVASLIYALAFWASSSADAASAITGAVLLGVAGLALPAIIRIVAPAAESISGSGAQMAALSGAVGAMAGSLASSGGGARGAAGTGGAGGSSGTSGSAASGSAAYGGRYTGGGSSGSQAGRPANAAGPSGASAAKAVGQGVRGATRTAAGLAGGAIGGAAKALQVAGKGVSTTANIAEGAIGNYQGRIPR